ncbi:MAG: hypothetical protein WDM92_08145 [Caulobacteraceae bacterium]
MARKTAAPAPIPCRRTSRSGSIPSSCCRGRRAATTRAMERALRPSAWTMRMWRVLMILAEQGPCAIGEIADLAVSSPRPCRASSAGCNALA